MPAPFQSVSISGSSQFQSIPMTGEVDKQRPVKHRPKALGQFKSLSEINPAVKKKTPPKHLSQFKSVLSSPSPKGSSLPPKSGGDDGIVKKVVKHKPLHSQDDKRSNSSVHSRPKSTTSMARRKSGSPSDNASVTSGASVVSTTPVKKSNSFTAGRKWHPKISPEKATEDDTFTTPKKSSSFSGRRGKGSPETVSLGGGSLHTDSHKPKASPDKSGSLGDSLHANPNMPLRRGRKKDPEKATPEKKVRSSSLGAIRDARSRVAANKSNAESDDDDATGSPSSTRPRSVRKKLKDVENLDEPNNKKSGSLHSIRSIFKKKDADNPDETNTKKSGSSHSTRSIFKKKDVSSSSEPSKKDTLSNSERSKKDTLSNSERSKKDTLSNSERSKERSAEGEEEHENKVIFRSNSLGALGSRFKKRSTNVEDSSHSANATFDSKPVKHKPLKKAPSTSPARSRELETLNMDGVSNHSGRSGTGISFKKKDPLTSSSARSSLAKTTATDGNDRRTSGMVRSSSLGALNSARLKKRPSEDSSNASFANRPLVQKKPLKKAPTAPKSRFRDFENLDKRILLSVSLDGVSNHSARTLGSEPGFRRSSSLGALGSAQKVSCASNGIVEPTANASFPEVEDEEALHDSGHNFSKSPRRGRKRSAGKKQVRSSSLGALRDAGARSRAGRASGDGDPSSSLAEQDRPLGDSSHSMKSTKRGRKRDAGGSGNRRSSSVGTLRGLKHDHKDASEKNENSEPENPLKARVAEMTSMYLEFKKKAAEVKKLSGEEANDDEISPLMPSFAVSDVQSAESGQVTGVSSQYNSGEPASEEAAASVAGGRTAATAQSDVMSLRTEVAKKQEELQAAEHDSTPTDSDVMSLRMEFVKKKEELLAAERAIFKKERSDVVDAHTAAMKKKEELYMAERAAFEMEKTMLAKERKEATDGRMARILELEDLLSSERARFQREKEAMSKQYNDTLESERANYQKQIKDAQINFECVSFEADSLKAELEEEKQKNEDLKRVLDVLSKQLESDGVQLPNDEGLAKLAGLTNSASELVTDDAMFLEDDEEEGVALKDLM